LFTINNDLSLDKSILSGIIKKNISPLSARTEESSAVKVDRKARAQTETLAQWKPQEVPSRAAQVNVQKNH
jgi:hypothetical protein